MGNALFWSLWWLCLLTAGGQDSATDIRIQPTEIAMDMFFTGATVRVEGRVPEGVRDVAVVLSGPEEELELKKKGRVGGVLWMNVGEIDFHRIPTVYVVAATGPLETIASRSTRERLGVGYGVLETRSTSGPGNEEQRLLFDDLLALKEEGGFYALHADGAHLAPGTGHEPRRFSADCRLPNQVSTGEYSVQVFGFRGPLGGGEGALLATTRITVQQVGVSAMISSLARDSGLLYGILAIAVAIVVGLLTGLAFGARSKGGH